MKRLSSDFKWPRLFRPSGARSFHRSIPAQRPRWPAKSISFKKNAMTCHDYEFQSAKSRNMSYIMHVFHCFVLPCSELYNYLHSLLVITLNRLIHIPAHITQDPTSKSSMCMYLFCLIFVNPSMNPCFARKAPLVPGLTMGSWLMYTPHLLTSSADRAQKSCLPEK